MKNIKYIILTIVCITAFSCGDDTFTRAYVDDEVKTPLTGTIAITNPSTTIYSGDAVEYTVTLPQIFTVESTVEVTLTSYLNSFEFNPFEEKFYLTIPASSASISGSFDMPDFGAEAPFKIGIPEFSSVSLTGVALSQPEDDPKLDDPYTLTSEPVLLTLLARSPWMNPRENTLMMSLDWEGPYEGLNDLDLYLYDIDFDVRYENSWETVRFEGDFINNRGGEDYPDGDYLVYIEMWTSASDALIPYQLIFTYPDGSREIYEGDIDPAVGSAEPVIVTKSTDTDGNPVYSTAANI